jgi:hypothetical protein
MKNKNIHLLPTDKGQRITKTNKGTFLFCSVVAKDFIEIRKDYSGFHLYITSDEEIKEGDWVITPTNDIIQWAKVFQPIGKKIILTTNPKLIDDGIQAIDDEFLEWFVKNSSCEKVEVTDYFNPKNIVYGHNTEPYKIIIPQEEPKQYTSKELEGFEDFKSLIKQKQEEPKQDTVGKEFYETADMTITVKRQEQIKQLAEEEYWMKDEQYERGAFVNGYSQCQDDMLEILRSEIKRAYQYGQTNAQMMEAGLERDEVEEYVNFRMLSFKNK